MLSALLFASLVLPRQQAPATPPEEQVKAVVAWVKKDAIPLKTAKAESGLDDMMPIKKLVGDAKIVSLGESTHGSKEIFQMKHRMLEFLVKEMAFNVFAIEASYPDCLAINEYVLTGKGDLNEAVSGQGFWTWDTVEVMDMVEWMRKYNADPAHKKVRFYGYDMQNPSSASKVALAYLRKVDPALAKPYERAMKPIADMVAMRAYDKASDEDVKALQTALKGILKAFDDNKQKLIAATSRDEFEDARQSAVVAIQGEEGLAMRRPAASAASPAPMTVNWRDKCMADNHAWILERLGPGTKIVGWAHNGHVTMDKPEAVAWKNMGGYLDDRFGKDHLAVGFSIARGLLQAIYSPAPADAKDKGLLGFYFEPAKPGSIDHTLALAGIPRFILDLRETHGDKDVETWLGSTWGQFMVGAIYAPAENARWLRPVKLGKSFHAVIFLDTVDRAVPSPLRKQKGNITKLDPVNGKPKGN
jgi:erythromycin esterase